MSKKASHLRRPLWKKLTISAAICLAASMLLYLICDLSFLAFFDWNMKSGWLDMEHPIWDTLVWMQTGPAKIAISVWQALSLLLIWEYTRGRTDLSRKGFAMCWLVQLIPVIASVLIYFVVNRSGMLAVALSIVASPVLEMPIVLVLMLLTRRAQKAQADA